MSPLLQALMAGTGGGLMGGTADPLAWARQGSQLYTSGVGPQQGGQQAQQGVGVNVPYSTAGRSGSSPGSGTIFGNNNWGPVFDYENDPAYQATLGVPLANPGAPGRAGSQAYGPDGLPGFAPKPAQSMGNGWMGRVSGGVGADITGPAPRFGYSPTYENSPGGVSTPTTGGQNYQLPGGPNLPFVGNGGGQLPGGPNLPLAGGMQAMGRSPLAGAAPTPGAMPRPGAGAPGQRKVGGGPAAPQQGGGSIFPGFPMPGAPMGGGGMGGQPQQPNFGAPQHLPAGSQQQGGQTGNMNIYGQNGFGGSAQRMPWPRQRNF